MIAGVPEASPPDAGRDPTSAVRLPTWLSSFRTPTWLQPASVSLVWAGLATAAAGFVVLGLTWAKVAGLLDVPLQIPYLVSGGSAGVALVTTGLVTTHAAVRRREDARREVALERLADRLAEVRAALDDRSSRDDS